MKDDDPSTPEEQREAEALARALAGQASESAPPPDALEAAALLRYAHRGELDPGRAAALGAGVRAGLARRPRRSWWLWVVAPLGTGLAMMTLFGVNMSRRVPPLPALPPLPAPTAALLETQAAAARGRGEALGDLDAQMRSYRRELFARLQAGGRR